MERKLSILAILFAVPVMLLSFSQKSTITGRVTDSSGMPLAGVTVTVKGSRSGTVTDQGGNYSIEIKQGDDFLQFGMIGFVTITERIKNRTIINVIMREEKVSLDEVVVVGYGSGKQKSSWIRAEAAPAYSMISDGGFSRYNRAFNTEGYASTTENGFRSVISNPLSTFSIDVDNASWSNIRRFINNGSLPPPEAVRIEEMINYFRYDYPEPEGFHPFSLTSELSVCPWNRKHHLLLVGLKGRSIDKSSLPPSNIVFLIDVSGSMNSPDKLPLLKSAFGLLVNELRPRDRVAMVVYAGAAGLVLESTPGNRKDEIMNAISNIEAGGSTAGGAGLRLAYEVASKNFIKGGNNRIILATDGDFNVGESSNGGMERLVADNRDRGIFMTVLGFGKGNLKDDKMEIIADKGNGNYSYIDNLQEARRVLVKEFGGTLFTIAKDVKFQIEFNPAKVQSYRLIGYENRLLNEEDFNDDRKDAGEMGSGHNVTALYELVPAGTEDETPAVDPLKYQANPVIKPGKIPSDEFLAIKIRYKKPEGSSSVLLENVVRDYVRNIDSASDNLRFAAAVAEFGMILGDSEYKGNSSVDEAVRLAKSARGDDSEGYRAEFIRLMEAARDLGVMADK
ncbi:MAG: von Willebrand factor type A domain-containing protein [Bacteroidales bacterium]|nr:von Willebrand factor type A domain-containing protein [Bacteroidales bacterium]